MCIFDLFLSPENDNNIALRTSFGDLTLKEVKQYILKRKEEFENKKIKNVVLLGENHFDFIINFWAAIFAEKNLYLITDSKRLSCLTIEHILPEKITEKAEKLSKFEIPNLSEVNFFTSGSTGIPKLIKKNWEVILKEGIDTYDEFQSFWPKSPLVFTTSTPAHMFVLTFYVLLSFLKNFIIDTRKIEFPEQLEERLRDNSILVTSPSFLETLQKYNVKLNIDKLLIFSAGNKLPKSTHEYFENQKINIIDIYGSTETGNIAFKAVSTDKYLTKFRKVNLYLKENSLVVNSPFFLENEICLSDQAEILDENHFILRGRIDRLVKITEKRVSLIELEENLAKCKFVKNSYCFEYSKKLCVAIVLSDLGIKYFLEHGILQIKKELKKYLLNFVEIVPSRWKFLYEIPKTERGKVDINYLNEVFSTKLSLPLVTKVIYSEKMTEIEMLFPKTCNFFEGHFKNFPIVPGVVQLYFAQKYIETFCKVDIKVWQIKRIKFSNVILPDTIIKLRLINQHNFVTFEFLNQNGEIYSSGNFTKFKQKIETVDKL